MADGSLEAVGSRWRLRFRRNLAHPAERVWQALTTAEDLAVWFPQRISGQWRTGAQLRFDDPDGPGASFTGQVLRCDPPRLLEYTWGTDVLRFEIEPTAHGCTLTLADTFAEQGKAARDAAGWHVCLDTLGSALTGDSLRTDTMQRWSAVHPRYVTAFGPDGSSIGPPTA